MAMLENGSLQNSSVDPAAEKASSSPFYTRRVPSLFKDAYVSEQAASPKKAQELPNPNENVSAEQQPAKAPIPATGTSVERLGSYIKQNFAWLDADADGSLTDKELQVSLASTVNRDEMQMLSWMNKNIDALQFLGDLKAGVSNKDLDGLNRANEEGTGSLGFALRDYDLFYGGIGSVTGAALYGWLSKASNLRKAGVAAFILAGSAAVHAGIYYLKDRPKIDSAIDELKGLQNPNGGNSVPSQKELETRPAKAAE